MQVFHTILAELPEKNSIVTHRVTQQYMHNIYRPQTKFAKVMFLQVSVCPQEGGMRGCSGGRGGCVWLLRGHAWLLWGGMHGCSWGGICGEEGHAWQRGGGRYEIQPVIAWAVCILLECILVWQNYINFTQNNENYSLLQQRCSNSNFMRCKTLG